jgi:hypothetical protein
MAVLLPPVVLFPKEQYPREALFDPQVFNPMDLNPTAVLKIPPIREEPELLLDWRAQYPTEVLPGVRSPMLSMHPKTVPATVGVARVALPLALPQQMALAPFDIRTWPAVPQEFAQSMIPAPGLIALVPLPVSQLRLVLNPITSWQEPNGSANAVL